MKCLGCCPHLWWSTGLHLAPKSRPTSPVALCPNWGETEEVSRAEMNTQIYPVFWFKVVHLNHFNLVLIRLKCCITTLIYIFWIKLNCKYVRFPQLQSLLDVEFRARRSRGGKGRRAWPSSRMSSWWTGSWWCRSQASTTSTPRPTSDTPTPWRRRARTGRRQRTEGDPCCSMSIKRWGSPSCSSDFRT